MLKRVLELQLADDEGEVKLTLRKEETANTIVLSVSAPKVMVTAEEIKEALNVLEQFTK